MSYSLAPGTIIDDKYQIIEAIGEGGAGSVFKALEVGLDRVVALKLLHHTHVGDRESQERFKREGKILSALDHPNILLFYKFGMWNNEFPYISMEYLQGESLHEVLRRDQRISGVRCIIIAEQICDAMQYAHDRNVVHRDLKPTNIVLLEKPRADFVKIVDFGLARVLAGEDRSTQHLTKTGSLVGSIYYMSPEQCMGKVADARSDIYSAGCILYEALTGQPPLVADNPIGLMHLHVNVAPLPLQDLVPRDIDIPEGLASIVMRALAKDPSHRYQSMDEMRKDLLLVSSGRGADVIACAQAERRAKSGLTILVVTAVAGFAALITLYCRFSSLAVTNQPSFEISSEPHVLRNFPIAYCTERLARPSKNVTFLNGWLKKYGQTDLRGAGLAHFWLYIELTGNAHNVFLPRQGFRTEYYFHFFYRPQNLSAEAQEHLLLAQKSFAALLKHPQKLPSAALSDIVYCDLILSCQSSSPQQRLQLLQTALQKFGDVMESTLTEEVQKSMAEILEDTGDYALAETIRRKMIAPDNLQGMLRLSRCLFREGKIQEARVQLDIAIETLSQGGIWSVNLPGSPGLFHLVSEQLIDQGYSGRALEIIGRCHLPEDELQQKGKLAASGTDVVCCEIERHVMLQSSALYKLHRYSDAHDLLKRALELHPDLKWSILGTMIKNGAAGHIPIDSFIEAQTRGGGRSAIAGLAWSCSLTNPVLSTKLIREIEGYALSGDNSLLEGQAATIGSTLNNLKLYDEAAGFLQKAIIPIRQHGGMPEFFVAANLQLGNALSHTGKRELAARTLDETLSVARTTIVDNRDAWLFTLLGAKAAQAEILNDPINARKIYEQALAIARNSCEIPAPARVFLLLRYADVCKAQGDKDKARALLDEAERRLPSRCREANVPSLVN